MTNELTTTDQPPDASPQHGALSDLRQFAMALPVERIQEGLAIYSERRKAFREWLRLQLIEGIHYGYPPGVGPKFNDHGEQMAWKPGKGGQNGRMEVLPKEQWTFKPSFYKAGADFVCDLMGLRDEYKADMDAHAQLGSPKDTFVFACYLHSKSTGDLIGEGRGVRAVGQKGGDANNAIKMAKKSAKVDAVLNAYGLADLFTQDIEDMTPPRDRHENPNQRPDAPKVKPRGQRTPQANPVTLPMVNDIKGNWSGLPGALSGDSTTDRERYREWVAQTCGREFNPLSLAAWTMDDVCKCCDALSIPKPGEV